MIIQNPHQLQNTRRKLKGLEEQFAKALKRPVEDPYTRELTLRSLKRMINQLTEEIARYEAHAKAAKP